MSETTTGLRAVLSRPEVYELFQHVIGARAYMRKAINRYLAPVAGEKVLDIGCGPGGVLAYLPKVDYVGFDHSERYIQYASQRYAGRGRFHCDDVKNFAAYDHGGFDIAIAYGILHHLDDERAQGLFEIAKKALKPTGRILTVDPCFFDNQDPFSHYVSSNDRGQNVRHVRDYERLAQSVMGVADVHLDHGMSPLPYAACIMVCRP
ncbi:MAG: class I SAM-dependent methyltransferase [Oceanicaulis sp.]